MSTISLEWTLLARPFELDWRQQIVLSAVLAGDTNPEKGPVASNLVQDSGFFAAKKQQERLRGKLQAEASLDALLTFPYPEED